MSDDASGTALIPAVGATALPAASLGGDGAGAVQPVANTASGSAPPLTAQEIADTRRFCGYGIEASFAYMGPYVSGYSLQIDAILAALAPPDVVTLRTVFLANLYKLEAAIPNMSSTLIVEKAAVFQRNANEQAERNNLFDGWRRRLCFWLGVPAGAGIYPLTPEALVV